MDTVFIAIGYVFFRNKRGFSVKFKIDEATTDMKSINLQTKRKCFSLTATL